MLEALFLPAICHSLTRSCRKYQFMQANTQRRAAGLKDKIPDIQKTLETVRFLKARQADAEPLQTTFELNDTLYAKAEVPPTDEVFLWLGANVMLAYPLPEALELLSSKLSTAKASLVTCEEDLEFLREQITVGFWSTHGVIRTDWIRRWRLRSLVCTTGMSLNVGKTGRRATQ
jgi:prefoldin subunit 5